MENNQLNMTNALFDIDTWCVRFRGFVFLWIVMLRARARWLCCVVLFFFVDSPGVRGMLTLCVQSKMENQ